MSNVLIGIIGVILFIGLALAGALFLGPRFQESANNSKASATVQAISQIASAINMKNTDTGIVAASSESPWNFYPDYLKAIPGNPVAGGGVADLMTFAGAHDSTKKADVVIMTLGSSSTQTNVKICEAIARQTGMTMPANGPPLGNAVPSNPAGCFQSTVAIGAIPNNTYVAFAGI